ncbi:hypothetical protein PHABIO_262 [Pseudomonas phage Phabio]|uniref:Uncharacterized protein n=1 Tax=Pseudomonas phage Phabio TaxID=2006668 RepID=A0A1Y0SYQ5_9CAUD|nr:hypothetical protein MZD05_gp262 [Pseudomonas phage Phabio]ARV76893.1 hypothetical protein PHABIO_262 [Pseudomonas phage Phabio]
MEKQNSNVVYAQNTTVLIAVAELGGESIARSLGNNDAAITLEGEHLTIEDIQAALIGRTLKYLGQ